MNLLKLGDMPGPLSELDEKQQIVKARMLFVSALVSSFVFYYFMLKLSPKGLDFFPGRIVTATLSLIGLALTFSHTRFLFIRLFWGLVGFAYLGLYFYLLHINDWSVFHRWSYFVVAAIFCAISLSWKEYLLSAGIALAGPVLAGFASPLGPLELLHFHAANFVTFFVIGLSVRANFRHRDELVLLAKSLAHTSKMAALGEMAGGIAHEINNPLAIVTGSLHLLKRELQRSQVDLESSKNHIERIRSASERAAKIIEGLRIFSRDSTLDPFQSFAVGHLVNDTLDLCTTRFSEAGIELKISSVPDRQILGDRTGLNQVLLNLLNNAFDAVINTEEKWVRLEISAREREVEISVTDSGRGVPVEFRGKLMQPFFTTKPIGEGTGLGLSISDGIVKKHGGKLIYDAECENTRFVIRIPC